MGELSVSIAVQYVNESACSFHKMEDPFFIPCLAFHSLFFLYSFLSSRHFPSRQTFSYTEQVKCLPQKRQANTLGQFLSWTEYHLVP